MKDGKSQNMDVLFKTATLTEHPIESKQTVIMTAAEDSGIEKAYVELSCFTSCEIKKLKRVTQSRKLICPNSSEKT